MKIKVEYLILLLSSVFVSEIVSAQNVNIEELTQYVYPNNRYEQVGAYKFAADGESYYVSDGKTIKRFDTKTGEELEVVFDVTRTRENTLSEINGFEMSADCSKILVYVSSKPIYRHSFVASYYVYDVRSRLLKSLSDTFQYQRAPLFSPDGRMVAFVAENNIYIKKLDYGSEVQVTTDGKINEIINGVPDWVYEEEFSTTQSMTWSPDNLALSYLKYDESKVPVYSFPLYQGTCAPQNEYAYYPGVYSYKYPVAGEENSNVSLHCYNIETRKTNDIDMPGNNVEYIPSIEYAHSSQLLMVATLNRAQNRFELFAVNPKSTVLKSVYVDESEAWISPICYEDVSYQADGFVLVSERSGFAHLYKYTYAGALVEQLTSGDFNVTAYYGCDSKKRHFYQSTSGALNRVVKMRDKKGTVIISSENGSNSAAFAPMMNYYILNHNDIDTPPVYTLYNTSGKTVRTLENNKAYAERYSAIPEKEFFTINSDGCELNAYIVKPLDFDSSKKYPVIMYQYGGPGSQTVLNRWEMDWYYYYAMCGYIVVSVDGRGTGGREKAFQDVVYRRLGYFETIDQLNAAEYISTLPYVDADKIGIFGWSYGGYETLMAVSQPKSPYRAAVAVAPVTDWRYYDTVYTERYMLTPQENEDGYEQASPINLVGNLNCRLLLMSGTADDNVHFMNSLQYVSEMQSQGKLCDMLVFPNMNHSINFCDARTMVYAKMLDFFNVNLKD